MWFLLSSQAQNQLSHLLGKTVIYNNIQVKWNNDQRGPSNAMVTKDAELIFYSHLLVVRSTLYFNCFFFTGIPDQKIPVFFVKMKRKEKVCEIEFWQKVAGYPLKLDHPVDHQKTRRSNIRNVNKKVSNNYISPIKKELISCLG